MIDCVTFPAVTSLNHKLPRNLSVTGIIAPSDVWSFNHQERSSHPQQAAGGQFSKTLATVRHRLGNPKYTPPKFNHQESPAPTQQWSTSCEKTFADKLLTNCHSLCHLRSPTTKNALGFSSAKSCFTTAPIWVTSYFMSPGSAKSRRQEETNNESWTFNQSTNGKLNHK